jgi:TatD DNase family protein
VPSLVDTHCHLADPAFASDLEDVVARAAAAGVGHVVVIGESPEASARAVALAGRVDRLSATAGLHPHEASRWESGVADWLERAVTDERVVAIGETGLDFHYDNAPRDRQAEAFEAQLDLAARAGKPAVVHAREADPTMIAILRGHPGAVAVMHSFSGGSDFLDAAVGLGHYVSWSGMVTFKSWRNDDLVRRVPPERLLLETDAPYLAPVPHRGRRNEPAFLVATARRLADLLGTSLDRLAEITTGNALRVFGPRLATTGVTAPRRDP